MRELGAQLLAHAKTWTFEHGIPVLTVVVAAFLGLRGMRWWANGIARKAASDDPGQADAARRAATLAHIVRTAGNTAILTIAVITVLGELGVDIGPLLAGAGIAGIAIGFGAQSLMKDLISGFFLLVENQVRLGDVIKTGTHGGVVEAITLRTLVLRDLAGTLHVIPNGEVTAIENLTHGWSRAVLDIDVDYATDLDKAMTLLRAIGQALRADPSFSSLLIGDPEVLGVEALGQHAITLRVLAKTVPLKQWDVGRELRRRIKESFEKAGITIPFPQTVLSLREPFRIAKSSDDLPAG